MVKPRHTGPVRSSGRRRASCRPPPTLCGRIPFGQPAGGGRTEVRRGRNRPGEGVAAPCTWRPFGLHRSAVTGIPETGFGEGEEAAAALARHRPGRPPTGRRGAGPPPVGSVRRPPAL